jgi:hypothetical protein
MIKAPWTTPVLSHSNPIDTDLQIRKLRCGKVKETA